MRILFVVQRYGREVGGGAELHCRQFATRLAARDHHIEVVTSCALDYLDWSNQYQPGVEELDGVTVHRLPVAHSRDFRFFGPLDGRVPWGRKPVPLFLQLDWMKAQGPDLPELRLWLAEHAKRFDVVVFFTYLYYTTWAGLPMAASQRPTVLHPTAHDEPPFHLPLFDTTFRHPAGFAFSTEEERELVERRFRIERPSRVVGIGTDLDLSGDEELFRHRFGLGDRPFLLYIGRIDRHKGAHELFDYFTEFKSRNPGDLALVYIGSVSEPLPDHPDVVTTGFVEDEVRISALAGCLALVQPSYFESFSMVLSEAWVMRKPALVQGHCEVLVGQSRRSGGGIPYRGFAEFEAALERLIEDPLLRRDLGESGRRYVEERYGWDEVLASYEEFLEQISAVGVSSSRQTS